MNSDKPTEYMIDFEENGGEYTGHLRIITRDYLSLHGERVIKIGDTIIQLDEVIVTVDVWNGKDWVNIIESVRAKKSKISVTGVPIP